LNINLATVKEESSDSSSSPSEKEWDIYRDKVQKKKMINLPDDFLMPTPGRENNKIELQPNLKKVNTTLLRRNSMTSR
jgi:hypothetical protein